MLACHFELLNFRFPVLWNTLHKLSADNVVLTSFLLISLPPLLTECISLFQKKLPTTNSKKKKKSLQKNLFQVPGAVHPPSQPWSSGAMLAPFSMWWHHHSSVITVLYLSDIQHRYHDNRKRTVQSHYLPEYFLPHKKHPHTPHAQIAMLWSQVYKHMYTHPDVSAQTGCLQQPHLLSMGSASLTVLLIIQVFWWAALFGECLL